MKIGENIKDHIRKGFEDFRNQQIQETMQVLKNPLKVFWSWGVSNLTNYYNKALRLRVNGLLHKGHVYVLVAFNDTYTVVITKVKGEIISIHENIYFEQLQSVVDGLVEKNCTDEEYNKKVKEVTYFL